MQSGKKRLPPTKLKILYFLSEHGSHDSSILQLSRDMGYASDSTVNMNLNDLIRDGFVTDKPVFKLTEAGQKELRFTRLPDAILGVLIAIGGVDIVVSMEALLGFGQINPLSTLGLGVAVVILGVLFVRMKRQTFDDFLEVREPLSPIESMSRSPGDSDSTG